MSTEPDTRLDVVFYVSEPAAHEIDDFARLACARLKRVLRKLSAGQLYWQQPTPRQQEARHLRVPTGWLGLGLGETWPVLLAPD